MGADGDLILLASSRFGMFRSSQPRYLNDKSMCVHRILGNRMFRASRSSTQPIGQVPMHACSIQWWHHELLLRSMAVNDVVCGIRKFGATSGSERGSVCRLAADICVKLGGVG